VLPSGVQAKSRTGSPCRAARPETSSALAGTIASRTSGKGVPSSTSSSGVGVSVAVGVGVGDGVTVAVAVAVGVRVAVRVGTGVSGRVTVAVGTAGPGLQAARQQTPIRYSRHFRRIRFI